MTDSELLNGLKDTEQDTKQSDGACASLAFMKTDDVKNSVTRQLVHGVFERDKEIKRLISIIHSPDQDRKKVEEARGIVALKTKELKQLQTQLREAEKILDQSLYEAKEKLKAIKKANKGIISSEELIAYGHKLSMANVISPPVGWLPGDGRRPYPTDVDMRRGILARTNRDISIDRVSDLSKPDVAMETNQQTMESEPSVWKAPPELDSLTGKTFDSFSTNVTNDVSPSAVGLANGQENSPEGDDSDSASDSSPSSSSSDD
ncbi:mediator of RNA polymerase II transcription subunit 4-like [Corticium candelabrum]|uniref:mediator of RNA polymerase II transcription subunit 4-like n=1 Tax=Corticium candelabrum TaxID=121492 RepID=UPI002E272352|nr:mediator of RNA polymerase II transcription subunit 4-like [Corticium candelabrum]